MHTPTKPRNIFARLTIPASEKALIDLNEFIEAHVTEDPPVLPEIVVRYPILSKIGKIIQTILNNPEKTAINDDVAKKIEKGFRYMLSQFTEHFISQTMSQLSLQNVKSATNFLNRINRESLLNNGLQEKNCSFANENQDLRERLQEKDDIIEDLRQKINKLEGNKIINESKEQVKILLKDINKTEDCLTDMEEYLSKSGDDFCHNDENSENIELSTKRLTKSRVELERDETRALESLSLFEKSPIHKNSKEDEYLAIISKIQAEYRSQQAQLETAVAIIKKTEYMLNVQGKIIDLLYQTIQAENKKLKDLKDKFGILRNENTEIKSNNGNIISKNESLSKMVSDHEEIFNQIKMVLNKDANNEDLPSVIKQKLSMVEEKTPKSNKSKVGDIKREVLGENDGRYPNQILIIKNGIEEEETHQFQNKENTDQKRRGASKIIPPSKIHQYNKDKKSRNLSHGENVNTINQDELTNGHRKIPKPNNNKSITKFAYKI